MVDRFINLNEDVGMDSSKELKDIIKDVGEGEELIITMDRNAADNSGLLFDMLKENGFEVLPKGGDDDDKYHIVAQRKK
ncbi:hypothetical protein R9X47_26520 [Wukongibacter baidiensis]|uniref:hypothetical protein n=1 Tax=Wukongibacter baidiensis TaxID=1723361 RepID=UPI003D7FEB97